MNEMQYVKYVHYETEAEIKLPLYLHGCFCALFERLGYDFVREPRFDEGDMVRPSELETARCKITAREWFGRDPDSDEIIPAWYYQLDGNKIWHPEVNLQPAPPHR